MYEEDMQQVLAMYASLFGDTCNEALLLDFLGSPTRQAVMLARAYNAKERKLQINSSTRVSDELEGEADEEAGFIRAMLSLREEAEKRGLVYSAEQFGDEEPEEFPKRESRRVWEDRKPEPADEEPAVAAEPADEATEGRTEAADGQDSSAEKEQSEAKTADDIFEHFAANANSAVHVKDDEELKFDFSARDIPKKPEPQKKPAETIRKTSIPLAVLYCIFAVPIATAISVILLIPAFLSLALAGAGVIVSFKLITSAFGGFAIFADVMVVLGAGLVVAALGLLFLWVFVWFIGGAIAGIVSGAIRLGEKLCTREVPAE